MQNPKIEQEGEMENLWSDLSGGGLLHHEAHVWWPSHCNMVPPEAHGFYVDDWVAGESINYQLAW